MQARPASLIWLARVAAVLALVLLLTGGLLWWSLPEPLQQAGQAILAARWYVLLACFLVALAVLATWARRWHDHHVGQVQRLAEQAQVLLAGPGHRSVTPGGNAPTRALLQLVNQLAAQRDQLQARMSELVLQASQDLADDKRRLEVLMAELPQAVLVCNAEGLILLYNRQAERLLRPQVPASASSVSTGWLGLGRSVYGLFEPQLLAHAMRELERHRDHGARSPRALFACLSPRGDRLRGHLAGVSGRAGEALTAHGFVLLMEDVSAELARAQAQASQLQALALAAQQGLRAALPKGLFETRADARPDDPALAAVHQALEQLLQHTTKAMKANWPLNDMQAQDLMALVQQQVQARQGLALPLDVMATNLWVRADSFSLVLAFDYLVQRLRTDLDVQTPSLRVDRKGQEVVLDVVWRTQPVSSETVMSWLIDPIRLGEQSVGLTLRDVLERHGAELGFERDPSHQLLCLRWVLPLAADWQNQAEPDSAPVAWPDQARPEFYDFDLFGHSPRTQALDDCLLSDLTYTVFDTETTGLQPAQGDAIIQIGAVRCRQGKVLRHEYFDQLVDPGRDIPAQTVAIHGIKPEMVRGQPAIAQVLPVFHRFAHDSVLVAHNAAFDMKFLQVQSRGSGLVFDHPVLDTLLLSAMVHPNQTSHRLEAIAQRFGIPVLGRHTALGDALVTAEVWVRLIALLQAMGVHTLGQARQLAKQSYYARLRY